METDKILRLSSLSIKGLLLIILTQCCLGCVTFIGYDGPYKGQIVEKESGQPLEGVVVVGNWWLLSFTPAGATGTHYDTYETVTDKNGHFRIPGQGVQLFSRLDEVQLFVFKAGYENISGYVWNAVERLWTDKQTGKIVIPLKKLTKEERQRRYVTSPTDPNYKIKMFIRERNKESIELGRPKEHNLSEE